jgi:hypothetical protein
LLLFSFFSHRFFHFVARIAYHARIESVDGIVLLSL